MTEQQVQKLKLGIAPITERDILIVESGLEWVKANTTLEFDMNNDEDLAALPSCVRLFLIKFSDIQTMGTGVLSESIEGLSLSFADTDKNALLWQYAEELLSNFLKPRVRFVHAQRKWR